MKSHVAARMAAVEASRTMVASQKAEALRRQGVDVISLTVGEPDFNTPDHVKDAAKRALDENFTHYTAPNGIEELRQAIAEKSQRENKIATDAAHTIVTPTKFALFSTLLATVDPGDEVLVTDPCFVSYVPQIKLCGGVPVRVPLNPAEGFSINAEEVQKRITKKTKAIMLCSPSNPTGMLDKPDQVKAVVDLAKDHDFLIISDEIYEKLIYDGGKALSPASLPGGGERTVTINGLSKSFAMTGWRIGWLHAPDPVFGAIAKIQTQSLTHITSIVQKAALAALQGPMTSVDTMREAFRKRRDLVVEEIKKTPGLTLQNKPAGAFYAWPRFDAPVDSDAMAEFLLEKAHVGVVAGSAFGPTGDKHFRISYATAEPKLKEAFKRIREALPKLQPATLAGARKA